ncbi:MAG: hypothetical protein ACRCYQ_11600 [Nocardioides sp.]
MTGIRDHDGDMSSGTSGGKRGGARRGAPPTRRFTPAAFGCAAGAILAVAAWGYLVYVAIGFGQTARAGDTFAWVKLIGATGIAVACLFGALILVARLLKILEVSRSTAPSAPRNAIAQATDELQR